MVEPDTIIDGRYRVISRVGSGGMADVYLAEDELLGRQVAVKVLHHHFAEDQEFVERFRREASSAAALSHQNIVAIFDRGEWQGTYYIAMEYVAGRSLKSIVREQGALEPALAIDITCQILQAARFAHRHGVIHRDLKPHNVLLDEDGRVRVTDFGIARAGASDMTLTGSIMGTAQYLSPEQAQGHPVGETSDLYSVGVILYELLTGVVPFEGETAVAIAFKQVSAEPRPPSELNPAVPAALDAIVLRALAKDPARRYASADEFLAALARERELLPAPAATAATVMVAASAPRAVGVDRRGPAGPPTGSLLLAPGGRHDERPEPEPPPPDRRRRWMWALLAVLIAAAVAIALLLSGPAEKVVVPGVVGQTEQAAAARLRVAHLSPVATTSVSATVPIGLVVLQTPQAGARLSKNSRVTIVISNGPSSAAVQNVEGEPASSALAALRAAGFKPTTKSQPSATVAPGRAIATDPPAGTVALTGSPVTVLVSSGPAQVRVPDVLGESQTAAEAAITSAGLEVGAIESRTSTQTAGSVIAQSPHAGASLASGSKVSLTIARATTEVTVPNVVGQGEATAAAALGAAGLTPKIHSQPTSEASQVGVVLRQSPPGGHHAHKGATVTLTVATQGPQTTTTPTTTTPATSTPTTTTTGATPPPAAALALP
ncbi:MAG TPA: Stk1 family PASTA domain-containing Ser/Thr kinase [Solirubrobacteraceae bacterium]|jgi:serine/threonine-protein kinase|nr:Stk1 family PASTA domain-containing Ser/Thr kinase [Solirubrobacteraceae bacterium]